MPTTVRYNTTPTNSDTALYTSSGQTTIRRIVAYTADSSDHTVTLSVHRSLSGNVEDLGDALPVPAGKAIDVLDDRLLTYSEIVLYDGDSLHGKADASSEVHVLAY